MSQRTRARAVTFSAAQSKKVNSNLNSFQNKLAEKALPKIKVDEDFYRKVIELENEIQLSQNPSMESMEELIKLYEKGVEHFTETHSRKKVQYFKKVKNSVHILVPIIKSYINFLIIKEHTDLRDFVYKIVHRAFDRIILKQKILTI